jgi:hypothetical protein
VLLIPFLLRLLRTPRAVREDRGDLREDDAARRMVEAEDELEEIEEEEEEG